MNKKTKYTPRMTLTCLNRGLPLAAVATILLTGCASEKPPVQEFNRLADPAVSAVPITPSEPAHVTAIEQTPVPVYQDAKITKVLLDAYVNDRGEAFPPTWKYVISQSGGWNMSALRTPERAYIPPQNSVQIQTAPGTQYTDYTQNASPDDGTPTHPAYNLKDMRVTGFAQLSQESQARAMAAPTETVFFDEHLGWVIVPKASVDKANGVITPAPDQPKPETDTQTLGSSGQSLAPPPEQSAPPASLPTPTTVTPAPPAPPAPSVDQTKPAASAPLDGAEPKMD